MYDTKEDGLHRITADLERIQVSFTIAYKLTGCPKQ